MEGLLAALEAELEETEKQLEREEAVPETTGYRLPEKLEDRQALRQTIQEGLEQLQREAREHYHPKEPEARRMKSQGRQPFAYNAQAVVEQSHGIVVAVEVTQEEEDSNQLVPMVEQAQQNTGKSSVVTVADRWPRRRNEISTC
jgi:hypothetical protein